MSGGQWVNPIDVAVEAVPTTLLTNIADDLRCLHKGNGQTSLSSIAADGTYVLDIGDVEQTFVLDLDTSYNLHFITTTNRQAGNTIHLIATGTGSVSIFNNSSSPPAGSEAILISGAGLGASSYSISSNSMWTFVYSGAYWYCNPYAMLT